MEFMLLLHSKNAYWLCTRCTIVVVAIEAVVVQWRVTHGVKAGAVLVWSAAWYMFGKGQFQELSSSKRDPLYLIWYTVSTLDCFTIRTAWDASTATDVPTHTGLVSPDQYNYLLEVVKFCFWFPVSVVTCNPQHRLDPHKSPWARDPRLHRVLRSPSPRNNRTCDRCHWGR